MAVGERLEIADGHDSAVLLSDSGSVRLFVLMVSTVVAGAALAMLALTTIEVSTTGNHRDGAEAFYAAEAILESVTDELAVAADWTPALTGVLKSRIFDPAGQPVAILAGPLDLARMTADLQTQSDAIAGWGPDNPRWRLFASGHLSSLWPGSGRASGIYLVVWIADDVADADGNPEADANGSVRIRAEAFGRRGSRRILETVVVRGQAAGVVRQTTRVEGR
jgi:hypothetical protein